MPFLAVGVEHHTAPLHVRESVALDAADVERLSRALAANPAIAEVAVLSTCNRTELYLVSDDPDRAEPAALEALGAGLIAQHVRRWNDMEAVEHLFRVASGLESQVLGEPQILNQIREMLSQGQELGTIGPNLHSLIRSAISCARQARAGTALGRVRASVSSLAVEAAERALGALEGRTILLIGGGEISRLAAEELRRRRAGRIYVANRTPAVAQEIARRFGGSPATLADIPRLLPRVDVVFSATGSRHHVLSLDDLAGWSGTLHIFDLALPRDIEPAVADVPGVTLHDLDSLLPESVAGHWEADIRTMESVIAGEVHEFMAWVLTRRVVPVIASLRSHVEAVSRQELRRVEPQLANLTEQERAAVESLTDRLIDKMFHHLVMRLRLAAQTDPALVDAAEFFFLHGEGSLFPHAAEMEAHPERESERR
jgi:glutamyl-tRNA reductase